MRRPVIMTDELPTEAQIVALAQTYAQRDRLTKLHEWIGQRHVSIVHDDNPETVTVQIEDLLFHDPRHGFPSAKVMAELGLALHAGYSDHNRAFKIENFDWSDSMNYASLGDDTLKQYRRAVDEITGISNAMFFEEAGNVAMNDLVKLTRDMRAKRSK